MKLAFGSDMIPLAQIPASLRRCSGQPLIVRGAAVAPVTRPKPDWYDMPTKIKNKPMPAALAILMQMGMIFTSQWRRPVKARNKKIQPSMKTAVRAIR